LGCDLHGKTLPVTGEKGTARPRYGVVVIGRNEGERLRRCLASARAGAARVVYVDSGSTDGSIDMARAMGAAMVALDAREPFTAARARNAGARRLREEMPELAFVQFVDGDCEIVDGWCERALEILDAQPELAVACGRRRERRPRSSVYNLLCDIEWDTPVGEARSCGGDAMMRLAAFVAVGGFRDDLIAGEEPELCVRLRAAGWRIWRLDAEMTLHDAALTRFGQWWRRTLRGGYAYAQGAQLHGARPERYGVRESRSIWFWALGVPFAATALVFAFGAWGLATLLAYPVQVARLAARGGRSPAENWWRAAFLVLGKFPELLGQLQFLLRHSLGARPRLIEYK
jgi:glycosyltransferase involved in cell wall biosynthesis